MPASMTITPLYAWQNAERRLFDYFATRLGDGGYLEEYSKFAPDSGEMWTFHIGGTGDGQMEPMPFWSLGAEFSGFYLKRSAAQQAWGRLAKELKLLVQPGVVEGVVSVRFTSGPTIERAKMNANQDETAKGGEIRGWSLTVPMIVEFVNTEPEIAGESNDTRND